MNNTFITIKDLRVYARHGVGAQEFLVGNEFSVDLRLAYDASAAMLSDDVADALNYAEVAVVVKSTMDIPSKLLEHVAARIQTALIARFPAIESGEITVTKITPPIPGTIGSVAFTLLF